MLACVTCRVFELTNWCDQARSSMSRRKCTPTALGLDNSPLNIAGTKRNADQIKRAQPYRLVRDCGCANRCQNHERAFVAVARRS